MSRRNTPGTVPFALDISTEAKSRFMALHEAFGFTSKTATFEAVVFAMSLKDKIDPKILQSIDAKLTEFLKVWRKPCEGWNDLRTQVHVAQPP